MLNRHFLDFLGLLAKHGVDYLVIGGYAVAVHGFPRFTGDLDVFVATSRQNARHMLEVFAEFGFASLKLTEDDLLEPDTVIEVGREPLKIQVLTGIDGISFERCRADRMMVAAGGLQIPFIGLDSLLVNKAASNRAKDQIDFAELTRLQGLRGRPGGGPTGE
jgi:predicted nucleotidyltransferase